MSEIPRGILAFPKCPCDLSHEVFCFLLGEEQFWEIQVGAGNFCWEKSNFLTTKTKWGPTITCCEIISRI